MTRTEAAEKVAKLRRLAKGTPNQHEAVSARSRADKIIAEHHLNETDLDAGEKAAAFDDLVDRLKTFALSHTSAMGEMFDHSAILTDVLNKIKQMKEVDKALRLGHLTTALRTACFLTGGTSPTLQEVKRILDDTLHTHEIKL